MFKKSIAAIIIATFFVGVLTGCASDGKPIENDYISISKYLGIEVDKVEPESVSDESIMEEIESSLSSNSSLVAVTDRAIKEGDTVICDYVGTVDGTAFDGGSAEDYSVEITADDNGYAKGFTSNMIGHKEGDEFDGQVVFPDDYGETSLAGKTAVFHYVVKGVSEKVAAELTDKFVKDNIDGVNTVDEWKKKIRKEKEEANQKNADYQMQQKVWSSVLDNTEVKKYPEDEVDEKFKSLKESYTNYAEQSGLTYEDFVKNNMNSTVEEFEKQVKNTAESTVKSDLIVKAIAKKCRLNLSKKKYNKELDKMAKEYGFDDIDALVNAYGNSVSVDSLKEQILKDKVQEYLLKKAKIVSKDSKEQSADTSTKESESN